MLWFMYGRLDSLFDFWMHSWLLKHILVLPISETRYRFIGLLVKNQTANSAKNNRLWFRLHFPQKVVYGTFCRRSGASWDAKGSQSEFWEWTTGSLHPTWTFWWGAFQFFPMQSSFDFVRFWDAVWNDFAFILEAKIHPKMESEMENVCFWLWTFRVGESSI